MHTLTNNSSQHFIQHRAAKKIKNKRGICHFVPQCQSIFPTLMKIFKGTGSGFFLCIGTRYCSNNNSLTPNTIQGKPSKHEKMQPLPNNEETLSIDFLKITMMLYHGSFLYEFFLMLTFLLQTFYKVLSPDGAGFGPKKPI